MHSARKGRASGGEFCIPAGQRKENMKNELYDWQKKVLFVVGFVTAIAIAYRNRGSPGGIGFGLDVIIGVGLNVLILWLIFKFSNWVYRKNQKNN